MKKIYFATDFHLGVPTLEDSQKREKLLLEFLDSIKDDCEELFLMGDLFDFWFEYKTVIPRGHVRLLGKLADFIDSGIPVHLFAGNHDLWTFSYLQEEIGIQVHRDPEVMMLKGKKFFLVHGDGRGEGDNGYKFLKSMFESKWLQWMFRHVHPDFGIKVALKWSHNHRVNKLKKESEGNYYNDIENTRLYKYAMSELEKDPTIDFFVFGHQHKPMQYKTDEHAVTTVVGNWIWDYTYAVFDGETMSLRHFDRNETE